MKFPTYTTPEGAVNLLLGTVLAAALFFGLLFAAIHFGVLPTI